MKRRLEFFFLLQVASKGFGVHVGLAVQRISSSRLVGLHPLHRLAGLLAVKQRLALKRAARRQKAILFSLSPLSP